ncbi:DNA repair protein RecN [Limibacter armeniacum]|uniref:DNA repair protein RecN n=1 Tax=Limibacter armeniacum TaxID=466084 RepID=UPI002FE501D7
MLKHLLIKNYTLIEHTEISPAEGLNMITGETGAGKSIMLGALGLLKGTRADSKVLFDESMKCVIEGAFNIQEYHMRDLFTDLELDYEKITILRREITPAGKSRAFINDTPVKLDVLRKVSEKLMDIHSQHDTLQLGSNAYQLGLIDIYAQNTSLLQKYQQQYTSYKKAENAYNQLLAEHNQIKNEFEFNSHMLQELTDMNLDDIEQTSMEEELEMLENAENIKSSLNTALEFLSRADFSAESSLKSVIGTLGHISSFSSKLEDLKNRTDSCLIELMDIVYEIEKEDSDLFFDFERIESIKDQLNTLYSLQKKHHVNTLEELREVRDELQRKVDKVISFDDELLEAETQKKALWETMMEVGKELSAVRIQTIPKIETSLNSLLDSLGMPNAKVVVERREQEPTASGIDEVSVLFSANKGREPQPLKEVASGGEFSRLMLAVKYILASKTSLPTIIFDEIDTGISGEIAIKVGQIMKDMGKSHQVITISHLPQIAALGEKHYYVYKDNSSEKTISRMRALNDDERLHEIAQMIGGANPSEMALNSARELIEAGA